MDDREIISAGDSGQQGSKAAFETFTARTLLVREGFPRLAWRGHEPVVLDRDCDGITYV
jgi:hypothetical protein